jgi:hypothetical protein
MLLHEAQEEMEFVVCACVGQAQSHLIQGSPRYRLFSSKESEEIDSSRTVAFREQLGHLAVEGSVIR